jgi:hypothetical protein
MCRSHHAVETRLHEEIKARKKLQKDTKEVKKALYPNRTPSPRALKKGRATLLYHLSNAMQAMKTLILLSLLLLMLAPLTWSVALCLVMILDSKVHPLQHHHLLLFQSSQDLAWQMRLQPPSLVIQILVWLVVHTLFIILLCHLSLTHPYTPG